MQLFIIAVIASLIISAWPIVAQVPHGKEVKELKSGVPSKGDVETLTPTERKYQAFLPLINKMKADNVGSYINSFDIAKKYSDDYYIMVDDLGRIRMIIFLVADATYSDEKVVVEAIERVGGSRRPEGPSYSSVIEFETWIPYDKVELIMSLPQVAGSMVPPVAIHR
jgi:hypothetical protein